MINILIPMGGKSLFFEDSKYQFSKHLIDIKGKPMVQLVLEQYFPIKQDKKFIFVVNKEDCDKNHLDSVLNLVTENNCEIIKLRNNTKGAVCSSLMAIEHINSDDELIISNGDQVINVDFNDVIESIHDRKLDCAVITFDSLHPKWSFVRLEDNKIIETAEKKPISKNAIAGFYYFKSGKDFVKAAMNSIEKGASVNDLFYIAPVINELILEAKNIGAYQINSSKYHSFYSPDKIKDYEKKIQNDH